MWTRSLLTSNSPDPSILLGAPSLGFSRPPRYHDLIAERTPCPQPPSAPPRDRTPRRTPLPQPINPFLSGRGAAARWQRLRTEPIAPLALTPAPSRPPTTTELDTPLRALVRSTPPRAAPRGPRCQRASFAPWKRRKRRPTAQQNPHFCSSFHPPVCTRGRWEQFPPGTNPPATSDTSHPNQAQAEVLRGAD